ncbi:MAG TPA: isoprenylcysteine carboxylmethyltransferase family protein [Gemmatimonadaceae bacterium]|nr:isoprenylcysteine carboxylmethyltransferase family protein [Gemmatimonadaceae bacterium]
MRKTFMLLRHLIAILVLPFVMTIVVPRWIARRYGLVTEWDGGPAYILGHVAGAVCFLIGLWLFGWSLFLFATRGKGTLAPWDPPKHLVVTGPYRYVRNPMISGVLMIIAGEALFAGSLSLFVWMLTFFLFNQIHFLIYEEPSLESRFGDEYRGYKTGVPRWIPRLTPWGP